MGCRAAFRVTLCLAESSISASAPAQCRLDAHQLHNALLNLILNAVDAMRDLPGGTNLSPEFHGLTKEQAPKYAFSEIFAPFTKQ